MKVLQKLIQIFAIVAYVTIFLGGRALHQQYCHNSADCSDYKSNLGSLASALNVCASGHAHIPSNTFEESSHPTNDNSPKDEDSDCWTCYTLSQPLSSLAEIELQADIHLIYLVCDYFEDWRLQASIQSRLIRGPPNTSSATS